MPATMTLEPSDRRSGVVSVSIAIDGGSPFFGDVALPGLLGDAIREGQQILTRRHSRDGWKRVKVVFIERGVLYCRAIAGALVRA